MAVMILISFFLGVVLSQTVVVSACSCAINVTSTEKFCNADYAVIVRVIGNGSLTGGDMVYKLEMLATYRNKFPHDPVELNQVTTALNASLCGVTLADGGFYLLAGYYFSVGTNHVKKMKVSSCDLVQKFPTNPIHVYKPPKCNLLIDGDPRQENKHNQEGTGQQPISQGPDDIQGQASKNGTQTKGGEREQGENALNLNEEVERPQHGGAVNQTRRPGEA